MNGPITITDAEAIRAHFQYSRAEFSKKLGFTPLTYTIACGRGELSKRMQREIRVRYGRILSTVKSTT